MDIEKTIAACIESAQKVAGIYDYELDFSDESVTWVNDRLNNLHSEYLSLQEQGNTDTMPINSYAHIWGVYIGETLIRNYGSGYRWTESNYGLVLQKDSASMINPIAKAHKQIMGGMEAGDEIKPFYEIAILIMQGKFPR